MSQQFPGATRSYTTATDLSAKQYYIMQLSAANTVALSTAATEVLVGTLQNEPKSGESATVVTSGTAKVIAGGTITRGQWLTADSAGKAVSTVTTGNNVIGMALEAADANDIVEYQVGLFVRY